MVSDQADRLLSLLETDTTPYESLANELELSVSRVQDLAGELRNNGHDVITVTGEGYKLQSDQPDEPNPSDLTSREEYIVRELQTGSSTEELANGLDERHSVVNQHIRDLKQQGWQIYQDDTTDTIAIEGDQPLRSSEHKGTRTRKANKWWELSHNKLVREFRGLEQPEATTTPNGGTEDWLTHMTDIHAGDKVRNADGELVYSTNDVPRIIDYITKQSLKLADKHGSEYSRGVLLWGGDFLSNSGIYEGQFEDLDAWLDEQHDTLIEPLMGQLKAFSKRFDVVDVVCQVGNHGQHRASGTSKQANADLILYKTIRNTVSQLQKHSDLLDNVSMQIGEARPYKNFELRGGKVRGHLRHGQHRKPQAETSARKKEWLSTIRDHEFDVAFAGHYHITGRVPWDGPPILFSSSPKPSGSFVEKLGESVSGGKQGVATCVGVSDDGITSVFPVDTRNY